MESGSGDSVIRDFRQRMEDNKSQAAAQRGTIRTLGTLCSALAVVVLAGGVAMFNNYEKMKDMEAVLTAALPDQVVAKGEELPDEELWVEEASGNVYPTVAHETMSSTYPDGQATQETHMDPSQAQAEEGDNGEEDIGGEELAEGSGEKTIDSDNNKASDTPEPSQDGQARQALSDGNVYTVQDGETLYGICLKLYGNGSMLSKICELNGLEDENKIISGQNLILP